MHGYPMNYRNSITLYPTFQKYFRDRKPPILAVWRDEDPYFGPPGAEAFKKDDPNNAVKFYEDRAFCP